MATMLHELRMSWRYTYCSARRDGWSRKRSARMFAREFVKGVLDLPNRRAEERRARC